MRSRHSRYILNGRIVAKILILINEYGKNIKKDEITIDVLWKIMYNIK